MPSPASVSAAYYARRRRRARQSPFQGLTATHSLGVATASVDTDEVFPDRTLPVTFATRIKITGATAIGIVFEFGSSTNGAKLAIGSDKIYFAAGNGTGATTTGVDGEVALGLLAVTGAEFDLVAAINPGNGQIRVWVDGDLKLRVDEASATPMLSGVWAADNAGAVGAAQAGSSSTQRIGEVVNGAPSDFILVAPLRVAMNQTPWRWNG